MKPVTNKILWLFAVGQLGWSILSGIVANWLVYFYQPNAEAISAGQRIFITQGGVLLGMTVIGLISAVGRIFDAVTDPYIASRSDSCTHKDGRRIPFMRAVAIPFGIVTVLLFCSPVNGESPLNAAALLICALLFYLCMTIYCTPYNALIPELGKTQNDRINLSTYISVTYFLGTAVAYLLPNVAGLFEPAVGYVNSLRIAIGIFAALAVVCMFVPVLTIREKDYAVSTPTKSDVFASLGKTFRNKSFRTFVASDVVYWVALTIFQTGLPFYITSLMKLSSSYTFLLFAIMTGLSLVFYLPVNLLSKRLGKKRMVLFAFFFFSLAFLVTSFAGTLGLSGMVWGVLVAVMASLPMAILGILPQAIVADIAQCDALDTHENREGMFYAARTFAFKLGQSLAMLLFTAMAAIGENGFGYRISAVCAAVLCALGGIILCFYNERAIARRISEEPDHG